MATSDILCASETPRSRIRCRAEGEFATWLATSGASLAITTYTSGRLVLVSSSDGRIRYRERRLSKPMGIARSNDQLAVATKTEVLQFHNSSATGSKRKSNRQSKSSDAVFKLRQAYATGKLNAHDIAFGKRGIYFANTRFNCIARVSPEKKFIRVWQPPFLEGLIRQDRCHLNGIGMQEGRPAMATAFCATSHAGGWREENRFTQGVLIDVRKNRVVAKGLCMPHSPRLHNGRWWLCNSGHGTLVELEPDTGACLEVCSLPGFTRGLHLVGNHALVGLSRIRPKHILDAPPVRERHEKLISGVALVEITSGRHLGTLEFVEGGREVFDIAFLPRIRRPNLIYAADRSPRPATGSQSV